MAKWLWSVSIIHARIIRSAHPGGNNSLEAKLQPFSELKFSIHDVIIIEKMYAMRDASVDRFGAIPWNKGISRSIAY